MIEATRGKAIAASELRNKGFMDTFVRALGITSSGSSSSSSGSSNGIASSLTQAEGTALITLERDFLLKGSDLVNEVSSLMRAITNAAIVLEMEDMGIEPGLLDVLYVDAEIVPNDDGKDKLTLAQKDFFGIAKTNIDTTTKLTTTTKTKKDDKSHSSSSSNKKTTTAVTVGERMKIEKQSDIMRTIKEVEAINTEIMMLELDFIRSIVDILGPNRADMIRTAIVGNVIGAEVGMMLRTLKERPLSTILSSILLHDGNGAETTNNHRKNLYVTRFPGDVTASQLNELREEVTGILRSARPGDEALLILQSGGGTVTGYGLAAAQLLRFKAKDIKLTVCVEQVAASGGYMMCCTADRIVASPFAVLGSIGVISEIPNAYERLQREGIEFQTITAGKFKRTVTPTKKITKEDIKKSEADIAEIFNLFKGFVKRQRPQLDIDNVATGETWFGEDALAKGLCDEIGTADDVLLDFIDNDYDVFEVVYKPPTVSGVSLLAGLPGGRSDTSTSLDDQSIGGLLGWRSALRSVVRGVVSDVKDQIVTELSSSMNDMNSIERRYMALDNTADEIQTKD
jgi:signal peptide peptidase SppA